ncbi:MAG: tRNA (adenosine(37)-N6)-dimethylallyltransferase MiaA [Desulfomonile tiedjei]|nr:tRNA (adenosine(37)-N6)-dimethylallyltransferase MiaA [Desulfomonile tiedjei]
MKDRPPKIVVLAGPTASGKTEIGIRLAEAINAEIVSADSIQLYRYMDVGSAKPSPEERARIRHHMIDIRNPDEDFSAGDYVREARQCIRNILERGKLPLVVGGTGLYIRCLLGGILELPPSQPALRRKYLEEEEKGGPGTLFGKLAELDPPSAVRTGPENISRIVRAFEVMELTGKRMSELMLNHSFQDQPYRYLFLCLSPSRDKLYERIDVRVDSMIKGGLLDEVAMLQRRGYSRDLKPMQSLGYRHAAMILAGETTVEEAIRLMKRDTRRYAKRQGTWFRSEPEVLLCDPDEIDGIGLKIDDFLGG